jgi:hypothetical protein
MVMKKKGPLSQDLANYEDRIVIDEAKRKMDAMVKDAIDKGVAVNTDFFTPEKQIAINNQSSKYNIDPNYIKGRWHSNSENNSVNVPRTPSLGNLAIMAEEMEHHFNKNQLPTNPIEKVDWRWQEENRAKDAALRTSGGLFPQDLKNFEGTRSSYLNKLQDEIAAAQMAYDQGKEMSQRNSVSDTLLGLFWDSTAAKEDKDAYNYWNSQGTTPYKYFTNKYPQVRYGPLAANKGD